MSRARQNRRIARMWFTSVACDLGRLAGEEDAENFIRELSGLTFTDEYLDTEERLEQLRGTLAPSQESWDSGGRNAFAHEVDNCPKGYEDVYYTAYERGARRRIKREIKRESDALKAELEAENLAEAS